MQIDDLTAGLSLNFLIHLNTEQLQFESKILEVYPRRHTLLTGSKRFQKSPVRSSAIF